MVNQKFCQALFRVNVFLSWLIHVNKLLRLKNWIHMKDTLSLLYSQQKGVFIESSISKIQIVDEIIMKRPVSR